MWKKSWLFVLLCSFNMLYGQNRNLEKAGKWADSVFNSLTDDQRIAQLMIIRESSFTRHGPVYYDEIVRELIQKYNIGGICLFQGTPVKQASLINTFQSMAQTPLMVCIDGEWGLGMRLDSVKPLRHNMMLGATRDTLLAYRYGSLIGRQAKRIGIHVDYAPVVDINNNPANPVINDRSFGENKYTVASLGVAYMRGLQDEGIMASAKHFPGHGDVSVDSHFDLPVVNKTLAQLDSLELYPFRKLIEAGVASVMIAHLHIPALDNTPNVASSISKPIVTGLLREKMGFEGLTFTDALEMKGVAKYFPGGRIAAESLIAGNDMLCLPESVPDAIKAIRSAIRNGELSWEDVYAKCKKVLRDKYQYGMADPQPVKTAGLTDDLNSGVDDLNGDIARGAITLLKNEDAGFFPLNETDHGAIAYLGIGIDEANTFSSDLQENYQTGNFYFTYREGNRRIPSLVHLLQSRYKKVIIGLHNYNRYPARRFGISNEALDLIKQLSDAIPTLVFDFGNPYAIQFLSGPKNLVACYEDDPVTQRVTIELLQGKIPFRGTLPVTVSPDFPSGTGILR